MYNKFLINIHIYIYYKSINKSIKYYKKIFKKKKKIF